MPRKAQRYDFGLEVNKNIPSPPPDIVPTVEKNVPFPTKAVRSFKYPFGHMEVGDSFAVPGSSYSRIYSAASHYGKRSKTKFIVRKIPGTDEIRCWRIK